MKIRAYIYHKRAERYSDCQDYFGIDIANNRIAVSDGMSQSIFPQWWAQILVEAYLENGFIPDDISPLQLKWQRKLEEEIQRRDEEAKTNPKRNPWRIRNSLAERSGAGATLCGLTLGETDWTCECIGDSCLIAINHDYTLNFYTSQVGEFGNLPDYLDSFRVGRGTPVKRIVAQQVKALLMVSDPFAELFQKNENDFYFIKSRFEEIQALTDHNSYTQLVEKWRDNFGLHNDDSTLILIEDCQNFGMSLIHVDELSSLCDDEAYSVSNASNKAPKKEYENSNTQSSPSSESESNAPAKSEAEENFKEAFENVLQFYTGKQSKGKILDYLKSILNPLMDIFCKK